MIYLFLRNYNDNNNGKVTSQVDGPICRTFHVHYEVTFSDNPSRV